MASETTRDHIIQAADRLFYQQGYEHTSFSDIAAVVNISRGNFYHHFKTKDEILDAVIESRMAYTEEMLAHWQGEADTPAGRIRRFVHILLTNKDSILQFGCPVGALCGELGRLAHPLQGEANALFTLFRKWLKRQFTEGGRRKDADALAMHVLAFSQGVATLASAFHDEKFIRREISMMEQWLDRVLED
ncbi:MAG: TetR/AcrR family transcriptional regulator [Granulosicoccaceae bacterium]|jgi:AcrR family transcriptional regulator